MKFNEVPRDSRLSAMQEALERQRAHHVSLFAACVDTSLAIPSEAVRRAEPYVAPGCSPVTARYVPRRPTRRELLSGVSRTSCN